MLSPCRIRSIFPLFTSQRRAVLSFEIEINAFPSLENITLFIINPCPSSFLKGVFEISSSSFHRNIWLSWEPLASIFPSGLKAKVVTAFSCPFSFMIGSPSGYFQRIIERSLPAVAKLLPSGEIDEVNIWEAWPRCEWINFPESKFQNAHCLSEPTESSTGSWGWKLRALTFPWWNFSSRIGFPSFPSQIITELSIPAVEKFSLPGTKRTASTLWVPISNFSGASLLPSSQTRTLLSAAELINRLLSKEKSSDSTGRSCPLSVFRCRDVLYSQICTLPFSRAEIIRWPLLSNATWVSAASNLLIFCSCSASKRLHISKFPPAVPTAISSRFGWIFKSVTASSNFVADNCFLFFQSQTISFPSLEPETKISPRVLNSPAATELLCADKVEINSSSGTLRNCKFPSSPPTARISSCELKAKLFMLPLLKSFADLSISFSFIFHKKTVPSRLPEAKISPPMFRASLETGPRWPRRIPFAVVCWVSHILTVSSWPPVTANLPPGWRTREIAFCSWLEITRCLLPFWILYTSR